MKIVKRVRKVEMKEIELTVVDEKVRPVCRFRMNLVDTLVEFRFDNGYTEMSAPGFRSDWVRIKEDEAYIKAHMAKPVIVIDFKN